MDARLLAERVRSAWPQLRAALLTLHCLAVALAAIPSMANTHPLSVRDPQFAAEVHPWARLLGESDEAFAEHAEGARTAWVATHGLVIAPIEAYLALVGAQQPWDMFSTPNRTSARFSLETRDRGRPADADWQFLSGLPAGGWRRPFFESERTRSLLNHIARHADWQLADDLCLRLGRDALREDDRRAQARCLFSSEPSASWRTDGPAGATACPRIDHDRIVEREP